MPCRSNHFPAVEVRKNSKKRMQLFQLLSKQKVRTQFGHRDRGAPFTAFSGEVCWLAMQSTVPLFQSHLLKDLAVNVVLASTKHRCWICDVVHPLLRQDTPLPKAPEPKLLIPKESLLVLSSNFYFESLEQRRTSMEENNASDVVPRGKLKRRIFQTTFVFSNSNLSLAS